MSIHSRWPLLGTAFTLAGLCAVTSLPGQAAPAGRFPHATGRIVYKLSNKMMNGTSTLTWADHGKKIRQEMKAKANANGRPMDLNNWVISDGKNMYMHNPFLGQKVNRMKLTPEMLNSQGAGMPMMAAPKGLGKPVGKATVAGKPCTIHTMPQAGNAKIWVWQNLPLKMEATNPQAGGMSMVATKVETGIPVPPRTFQVPAGMQVQDFQMPKAPPAPRKP